LITDNYIKMCEKAEVIQKLFNPKGHNHTSHSGCIWTDIDRDSYKYDKYTEYGHQYICLRDGYLMHCIWLPTQEQLQEMSSLLCNFPCQILTFLNDWIKNNKIYLSEYKSMNELWLAFVMKEKYNKIWTGEKWTKI